MSTAENDEKLLVTTEVGMKKVEGVLLETEDSNSVDPQSDVDTGPTCNNCDDGQSDGTAVVCSEAVAVDVMKDDVVCEATAGTQSSTTEVPECVGGSSDAEDSHSTRPALPVVTSEERTTHDGTQVEQGSDSSVVEQSPDDDAKRLRNAKREALVKQLRKRKNADLALRHKKLQPIRAVERALMGVKDKKRNQETPLKLTGEKVRMSQSVTPAANQKRKHDTPLKLTGGKVMMSQAATPAAKHPVPQSPMRKRLRSHNTILQTPNLSTSSRSRNGEVLSYEQQQEQIADEMKRFKFVAQPVKPSVIRGPEVRPYRLKELNSSKDSVMTSSSNKRRSRSMDCLNKIGQTTPLPDVSKWKKKVTHAQPFKFDEADKERFAKKEAKIQKVFEEERKLREFHAQPLPDLHQPRGIPERPTGHHTKPQPFQLASVSRSELYRSKWENKIQLEEEQMQKCREFKARECTVLNKTGFKVKDTDKMPLTALRPFNLASEQRAPQRKEHFEYLKEREQKREEELRMQEEERKEQEQYITAQLRKHQQYRATPFPNLAPFKLKETTIPLTKPLSPKLGPQNRKRSQSVENLTE